MIRRQVEMTKRKSRLLRWIRWIILSIILLPVISLLLIRILGTMKMRMGDEEIMKSLAAYPIQKKIDTLHLVNRQITYLWTSKNEKKQNAIIFVHGSPGSLDAYLRYMSNDSLLAKADLITYDRPGFGHSDFGNTEPLLKNQAHVLTQLMDNLGYAGYWLVAHSYGGPVIVQAAIDHPDHIAGLAIIAGSVNFELEPKAAWRKWVDLPLIKELLPTSLRVSNQELMRLPEDLKMLDDDWDKITMPVSLMHGTKDMLVPFENLQLAKKKLVNADTVRTLIFEEENHFILWTQKEQIVKEISRLMNGKQG